MKKSNIIFFYLCLGSLFFACQKEIIIDLPKEQKLVVLSNITPDSTLKASISVSTKLNDSLAFVYPEDLTVQLFKDDVFLENLRLEPANGYYSLTPHYFAQNEITANGAYSLRIEDSRYPKVKAEATIPSQIPITSWEIKNRSVSRDTAYGGWEEVRLATELRFPVSTDEDQYFHLTAWRDIISYEVIYRDTIVFDSWREELDLRPTGNLHLTPLSHELGFLLNGKDIAQSEAVLEFELNLFHDPFYEYRSPVYFVLKHVSKDYYLFHKSITRQDGSNYREKQLFENPVFIHNNIEGGLGNFGAYHSTVDSLYW